MIGGLTMRSIPNRLMSIFLILECVNFSLRMMTPRNCDQMVLVRLITTASESGMSLTERKKKGVCNANMKAYIMRTVYCLWFLG